jgi:hypothetical protein
MERGGKGSVPEMRASLAGALPGSSPRGPGKAARRELSLQWVEASSSD